MRGVGSVGNEEKSSVVCDAIYKDLRSRGPPPPAEVDCVVPYTAG